MKFEKQNKMSKRLINNDGKRGGQGNFGVGWFSLIKASKYC